MLVISVRFLHGWLRAGSPSEVALTGQVDEGEWPPSPARLFSAFVAADGTRDRCMVTDGSELALLERARPPVIHADANADVLHNPIRERFVVDNRRVKTTVQEYPARTNTIDRPGTRLVPREPRVVYRFDDIDPSASELAALRRRAARIGYLGAADAPAAVEVHDSSEGVDGPVWAPDEHGEVALSVPFMGLTAVLDDAFDRTMHGERVERGWLPRRTAAYRPPGASTRGSTSAETVWMVFDEAVPGHLALLITETLREAVLSHHPDGANAPPVVHGHGFAARGWEQARYLPLVEVGHAFARGRVHGAAVWMPPQATAAERAGVRAAVLAIRRLVRGDVLDVAVSLHAGQQRPWAAHPQRWQGPSRRWVSATPVVHERHGRVDDAELARWCAHAGLPPPTQWRLSRSPLTVGGARVRADALRRRYGPSPVSHLAVEFPEPVTGPIAVGKGRQFGMGLLAPEAGAPHE